MRNLKGHFLGHIEGSIGELLGHHAYLLANLPWALLSSLDSRCILADMPRWNAPNVLKSEAKSIGSAVLVPSTAIVKYDSVRMFSGFDEVWFFRSAPKTPPPKEAWLVGPRNVDVDDVNEAISWMTAESCELGLGDGIGMNYIATTTNMASAIEKAFASQHD